MKIKSWRRSERTLKINQPKVLVLGSERFDVDVYIEFGLFSLAVQDLGRNGPGGNGALVRMVFMDFPVPHLGGRCWREI